MERSHGRTPTACLVCLAGFALAAASLLPAGGCAPLLATGIYLWDGGNVVPAECDALKDQRVVVVCRPPSLHEYRQAGASRNIAQRVSELLVDNLKGADVVNPREVDNWVDDNDWGDCRCGRARCATPGKNWLGRYLMDLRATLADARRAAGHRPDAVARP